MSQTSYNREMDVAIKGQPADGNDPRNDITTYNNPADVIVYGRGVVKVSGDENGTKLPASGSDDFLGAAVRNMNSTVENYPVKSNVPVMRRGRIYVEVDQTVTADDDVYCRYSGKAQVQTFVLDADLVASNVITVDVDGVTVNYTYATSHVASMTAFAALIAAQPGVNTAVFDGTRTITITAAVNGTDVVLTNEGITLGASQANITITETVASVADTEKGKFRKDADSSSALQVTNARYTKGASAGGLAIVDFNLV